MRKVLVFAVFLVFPMAQGTLQPSRESDVWREAGLDAGYARKFVNNRLCHKSSKFSEACTAALKRGLRFIADRGALTGALESRWRSRPVKPDYEAWLEQIGQAASEDARSMLYGLMVNDYLAAFDAHARILPVAALRQLFGAAATDDVSVGIETESNADGLFVRRVFAESPAAEAGIQVHDRILYLNGEAAGAGLQAHHMSRGLRGGEAGREVQLTLARGETVFPVSVGKVVLNAPAVSSEVIEAAGRKFGYIRIRVFREGVCARAESELAVLTEIKPDAVIVDLRGNSGGRNDEARCLYRLLETKPLPVTRDYFKQSLVPKELDLRPKSRPALENDELAPAQVFHALPAAVLINAASASVTELTAAAWQDTRRAWIIGERSFGKGTFQLTEPLHFHYGLRLVHSAHQVLRKGGVPIQQNGVTPDFPVPMRAEAGVLERQHLRERELYPTAPPPANARVWRDPRAGLRGRLQSCASRRSGEFSSALATVRGFEDFQQAFAMAVLDCQLGRVKHN